LKSASALERATVSKSFKFGASKETSSLYLGINVEDLIGLANDTDITVRGNVFESLTAITHSQPQSVKDSAKQIQAEATKYTVIDLSLIKEVDLGCFKHKVDEGIPVRKAAYGLIETLVEKVPERVNIELAVQSAIKGLEDLAEECMI
jgi:cullin-associated NEDD8-dissociated protein 1